MVYSKLVNKQAETQYLRLKSKFLIHNI